MADWHQIELTVPVDETDDAAGALWLAGARGVEIRDQSDPATVIGSFEGPGGDIALQPGWLCAHQGLSRWEDQVQWRAHSRVVTAGAVTVVPPWSTVPTDHEGLTITIDPGRAFGTGGHTSTALVLEVMADLVVEGGRVLDVGCGSGILAVTAARLGAVVDAVDIVPEAVEATGENARRNHVESRISVSRTPIHEIGDTYDVVLANIGSRTLRELAPSLRERVHHDGHLVLSGMLTEAWPTVRPCFPDMTVRDERVDDEWICATLQSPKADTTRSTKLAI